MLIAAAVPSTVHRFSDLNAGRTHYGPGNSLRARYDLWRQNLPKVAAQPGARKRLQVDRRGHLRHGRPGRGRQRRPGRALAQRLRAGGGGAGRARADLLHAGCCSGLGRCLRAQPQAGHARRRDPALTALSLGALAATSTYVLMSFDSNLMTQVAVSGTLWTVAAVGHAAGRVETHGTSRMIGSGPRRVRRVLMVNKFQYAKGGAELYMYGLAGLLEREGVDVRYFGMRHPRNLDSDTSRHYVSEVDFEQPRHRHRAAAGGRPRRLLGRGAAADVGDLLADQPAFDVAHLHNVYHQLSPSILAPLHRGRHPGGDDRARLQAGLPGLHAASHGEMCERCVGGHFQNAVRLRCNRGSLAGSALVAGETWLHRTLRLWEHGVDVFVTPSSYLREKLIAGGYPAERVVAVPNFVDPDSFRADREPGELLALPGPAQPREGRRDADRGGCRHPLELRSPAKARSGSGWRRWPQPAGAASSSSAIAPASDLERLVAGARAIVVPSRWPENCPLVVLEAMAARKAAGGKPGGWHPRAGARRRGGAARAARRGGAPA